MGRDEEAEMVAAGQDSSLPLPTSLWVAKHQAKLQGQPTALKVLKISSQEQRNL